MKLRGVTLWPTRDGEVEFVKAWLNIEARPYMSHARNCTPALDRIERGKSFWCREAVPHVRTVLD